LIVKETSSLKRANLTGKCKEIREYIGGIFILQNKQAGKRRKSLWFGGEMNSTPKRKAIIK